MNIKLWHEFKAFAFKGNVVDLAIAVVIGTAFGAVVNSLVKNVIMQAVSYITPAIGNYQEWMIGRVAIGAFIGDVVNFLLIAMSVFLAIVKLQSLFRRPAPPPPVTTRDCPFCAMTISLKASRCPHCTSELPAKA